MFVNVGDVNYNYVCLAKATNVKQRERDVNYTILNLCVHIVLKTLG